MTPIHEKVAGKLYIIGEYNVLKSGHGAIIAPVDLFLKGTILENGHTTIIENDERYDYHTLKHNCTVKQLTNTIAAISFFHEYLQINKICIKEFEYTIENNLISAKQIKYGLGSSAASVVLTLKLLDKFYDTKLTQLQLFKMAVLIQYRLNAFSSGGDLAATIFDKPVYYVRYDVEWLLSHDITFDLINTNWPMLRIETIAALPNFVIGWTKESFTPIVNGKLDDSFYDQAQIIVENYLKNYDAKYINEYQALLHSLANSKPGLLTKSLETLIKDAQNLNIAAKISGAGYGDCGIAQVSDVKLVRKLEQNGTKTKLKFYIFGELND